MNKKIFDTLKEYAKANDGCTLDFNGKTLVLNDGFMVSIEKYGIIYSSIDELDIVTLKRYMEIAKSKRAYIGFWIDTSDNNKFYLDISLKVAYKGNAIKLAKQENQLAIFDNARKECIYLK